MNSVGLFAIIISEMTPPEPTSFWHGFFSECREAMLVRAHRFGRVLERRVHIYLTLKSSGVQSRLCSISEFLYTYQVVQDFPIVAETHLLKKYWGRTFWEVHLLENNWDTKTNENELRKQ